MMIKKLIRFIIAEAAKKNKPAAAGSGL